MLPLLRSRYRFTRPAQRPGQQGVKAALRERESCFRRGVHGGVAVNRTAAGACTHACKPARLISPTSSQRPRTTQCTCKKNGDPVQFYRWMQQSSHVPAARAIDPTSSCWAVLLRTGRSSSNQSCVDGWSPTRFTRVDLCQSSWRLKQRNDRTRSCIPACDRVVSERLMRVARDKQRRQIKESFDLRRLSKYFA